MISSTSTNTSLLNYLTAQTTQTSGSKGNPTASSNSTTSSLSQAALIDAAKSTRANISERALDKQQASLAKDLHAAMTQAGVKLGGSVQFSVGSDGKLSMTGTDADKTAMTALLKADASKPSLSSRIVTVAQTADTLSASIRQHAAISQAARYGANSGGLTSLYGTLMKQQSTASSVYSVSASTATLAYPGVLAAKA